MELKLFATRPELEAALIGIWMQNKHSFNEIDISIGFDVHTKMYNLMWTVKE